MLTLIILFIVSVAMKARSFCIIFILIFSFNDIGLAYIVQSPTNQTICLGSRALFHCVVSDYSVIIWLVNGLDLIRQGIDDPATVPLSQGSGVESTLMVPGNPSFSGVSIVCTNGQVHSAPVFLTILGSSTLPELTSISLNSTFTSLRWSFTLDNYSSLSYQVGITDKLGVQVYNETLSSNELVYTVPDPCESYVAAVTAAYTYWKLTCLQIATVQIVGGTCEIINVNINATSLPGLWQADCTFISCSQSIGCVVFLNETFCVASKRYMNSSSSVFCPLSSNNLLPGPGLYKMKSYAVLSNGSYNLDCVYTEVLVLTNKAVTSPTTLPQTWQDGIFAIVGSLLGSVLVIEVGIAIIIITRSHYKRISQNLETVHQSAALITGVETSFSSNQNNVKILARNKGETELMKASRAGHEERVKYLLDNCAEVNSKDQSGQTALMKASSGGHVVCAKLLLMNGAQVDLLDEYRQTALIKASSGAHIVCAKLLVTNGAQVDLYDDKGQTALMIASAEGHVEFTKLLLDNSAQIDHQDVRGQTALIIASSKGHVECAKLLLDKSAQIHHQDLRGQTALMKASSGGHVECTMLLLDKGAEVDHQDMRGQTALMKASIGGHVECAMLLLDKGAEVDHEDQYRDTALMKASSGGHIKCVKLLLDKCVAVNHKNSDGHTALMIASLEGKHDCMQLLFEKGADVNLRDKNGNTALHMAVEGGHGGCVQLLLSTPGIYANPVNCKGQTPLMLATNYEVLTMLQKYTSSSEDFPVHTYGKVIICGDSGAGKSTLTEAIIHCSAFMSEEAVDLRHTGEDKIKSVRAMTAGIIPHRVNSPKTNITIYDLAGHREYHSSHSSILELICNTTPSVFVLLVNLLLTLKEITAQLYYWSVMIGNMCNCPQQSSIIVVGTHADCVSDKKLLQFLSSQIEKVARDAIKLHTFVQFTALNVTAFMGNELDSFMSLLYCSIDDMRDKCPAISLCCHVLYSFLIDKVPADQDAISLSELLTLLRKEYPMFLPTEAIEISKLLKTLSEKGLIVFLDSNPADCWIILHQDTLLEKVNGVLFAPADFDEHLPIASNTGVIPISVLKHHFPKPKYNLDMITQFLIRFELCQPINLDPINATHQGPPNSGCPNLFFPPLVPASRPDDVIIPWNAFCWQICITNINQFFSPRFLHVLVSRIAYQFPLPTSDLSLVPDLQPYNRRCSVWSRGISWRNTEGFTTVIEMREDFQCLTCAVSTFNKTSINYSKFVLSVIDVIKTACDEFCPSVSRMELITCPPEASSAHTSATVECEALKNMLLNCMATMSDVTGKEVNISLWREMEPQLSSLVHVELKKDDVTDLPPMLCAVPYKNILQCTKSLSDQWQATWENVTTANKLEMAL